MTSFPHNELIFKLINNESEIIMLRCSPSDRDTQIFTKARGLTKTRELSNSSASLNTQISGQQNGGFGLAHLWTGEVVEFSQDIRNTKNLILNS